MRRSPSPLPVAALVLCVCFVLALPPCADANVERHVLRYGPIHLAGYETVFPRARLRTPHVRGYVVRMHARLVDRAGRPVTIRDVMLHHSFFHRERAAPGRQPCAGTGGEPFYGTGEEDESLQLPTGYGYRVQASDRWTMRAMLMSHTVHAVTVYVQYDVRVEVRRRLIPVHAFWL